LSHGVDKTITSGNNEIAFYGEGYTFSMYFTSPTVNRVSGADQYETATKIANGCWAEGTEDIVLDTGEDFPDALAAGPLAFYLGGPILLTKKNQLPNTVLSFIEKSDVQTVTIVGGTAVISQQAENIKDSKIFPPFRKSRSKKEQTKISIIWSAYIGLFNDCLIDVHTFYKV
jgi:putative cell wall-binding protein